MLRVYHLGTQSLWVDELGEGTTAEAPLSQFIANLRADFGAAPLDYLGVKLFTSVAGHGTVGTRSWAFVMGSAGVFAIYLLGARLFKDRAAGLIAAAMLALSAFDIYYSQEARFYALAVLVGTLQIYAFLRATDSGSKRDWTVYGAVTVVALYSHFFLAALLPVEGLYLAGGTLVAVYRDRSNGRMRAALTQVGMCLAAQLLAFIVFVPWLVTELQFQTNAGYPLLPALGLSRIHQIFVVLIAMAPLNSTGPDGLGAILRTDLVLGLAAIGLAWELALRRWRALILAAIIAVAIPLAWRSDQAAHYFWSERQVIIVLVPLYLLAAIGLRHLLGTAASLLAQVSRREWSSLPSLSPRARVALAAGLSVVLVAGWAAAYRTPMVLVYSDRWAVKEDWRGVAAFIDSSGCPDTQYWTFLNAHYSYGFAYYDPGLMPRSHYLWSLPGGAYTTDTVEAVQTQQLGSRDWLVLSAPAVTAKKGANSADGALRGLGWSLRSFTSLNVYYQTTCGHSAHARSSDTS